MFKSLNFFIFTLILVALCAGCRPSVDYSSPTAYSKSLPKRYYPSEGGIPKSDVLRQNFPVTSDLKNIPERAKHPWQNNSVPQVTAKSVMVIDALTGRVLYEKNADVRRAVASTQKLMTALVVLEAGTIADSVTIAHSDTNVIPSKLYLNPGEVYPRSELLKGLLVSSANDAALALARDVAGSTKAFSALMNKKASELGMRNSNFVNPHGLTEPGQYSTARDMARLAYIANQHPYIRAFTRKRSYMFNRPKGKAKKIYNTNYLLEILPYCTGMKTGYTIAAGRCLISSGVHDGKAAIVVALGSSREAIWEDSAQLLKWALENGKEISKTRTKNNFKQHRKYNRWSAKAA